MRGVGGVLADEAEKRGVVDAVGFETSSLQRGEHGRVAGRLVDRGVLALGVEQDNGVASGGGLVDEPVHGGGLAAAGRAEDAGVAGKHGLALGGDGEIDAVVADGDAEAQGALHPEDVGGLLAGQHEGGAVGQRPESGRPEDAVGEFFAEDLDLDTAVVAGQEDPAPNGGGDDRGGIGAQPVGLGERASNDDPEVGAAVGMAPDAQHRLGRHLLYVVGRQQHRDGVVLAAGRVEHRAADGPDERFGLLPGLEVVQVGEGGQRDGLHSVAGGLVGLIGHGVAHFRVSRSLRCRNGSPASA